MELGGIAQRLALFLIIECCSRLFGVLVVLYLSVLVASSVAGVG